MTTVSPQPNRRAALLSGLRTGGVRSVSSPLASQPPHTAAPAGQFDVPRLSALSRNQLQRATYLEDEEELAEREDVVPDLAAYGGAQYNAGLGSRRPMTAAIDTTNDRMSQMLNQQHAHLVEKPHPQGSAHSKMNANSPPFVPGGFTRLRSASSNADLQSPIREQSQSQAQAQAAQRAQREQAQAQALAQARADAQAQAQAQAQAAQIQQAVAVQMLQLNMLKAQQAQLMAMNSPIGGDRNAQQTAYLALLQQQLAAAALQQQVPASAGPLRAAFDIQSPAGPSGRFPTNTSIHAAFETGPVPMSAALGGKFGGRTPFSTPNPKQQASFDSSLGNSIPPTPTTATTGKADSASNWRRGGNNNSVLSGNRVASAAPSFNSPTVRITPPPIERPLHKGRPEPLKFPSADAEESGSTSTGSSPTSIGAPLSSPSASSQQSFEGGPPTAREEASKKLYEGLGIHQRSSSTVKDDAVSTPVGRSRSATQSAHSNVGGSVKSTSIPIRQPRGPPAAADELGPKNFASRVRRKAIGGLGVLLDARERRTSLIQAY